ncbi:hypothetical protein PRIPAC_90023 [Pristionchus pacificus]|uniref:Uncharacterized protein n=1 Tax=Pristionchus pacificus TaxID=54126 RepID=A0A2A6B8R5_PRIPA|nr:hypothetical protein PRIPAC_90023 [Pristionchus pacificus]|eukprot:PDM62265.1 hypothetical protein PRIPAC_51707 [Pristionchus pacificus]
MRLLFVVLLVLAIPPLSAAIKCYEEQTVERGGTVVLKGVSVQASVRTRPSRSRRWAMWFRCNEVELSNKPRERPTPPPRPNHPSYPNGQLPKKRNSAVDSSGLLTFLSQQSPL